MKKIILLAVIALGFAFSANAQTPVFKDGTKVLNVGLGFGSYGSGCIPALRAQFHRP